jgi:hypothetical protein
MGELLAELLADEEAEEVEVAEDIGVGGDPSLEA